MTRIFRLRIPALFAALLILMLSCQNAARIDMQGWDPRVKDALNDFMQSNLNKGRYVVFDFDNTVSIGDIQQQVEAYQIFLMAFEMTPEEFPQMLSFHLKGFYADEISDISTDYKLLYEKYGPFHKTGVLATKLQKMHEDVLWQDFSSRLKALFNDVRRDERTAIRSAITFLMQKWFMPEECYQLALNACSLFSRIDTEKHTWKTPDGLKRKSGAKEATLYFGISVTEELKELWSVLKQNGIDIWVCSASQAEHIMAAIDHFGLHGLCTGVVAVNTCFDKGGRLDYAFGETGYEYLSNPDGSWRKGSHVFSAQPRSEKKVSCIEECIAPYYGGQKPVAAFGDSTSDFYFATVFESLELALYFNTGISSPKNGSGLVSMLALYEEEVLQYDYRKARKADDILFLVQGRNENGKRTLIPSKCNIAYGTKDEILFGSFDCYHTLKYIKKSGLSIKDAINTLSKKTSENESPFHVAYGWTENYQGYRTRK